MGKRTFDHQLDVVDETTRWFYRFSPSITHIARWKMHHHTLATKHTKPLTMRQARAWAHQHGLPLPVPPARGEQPTGPLPDAKAEGCRPHLGTFFGGQESPEASRG